MKVLVFLPVFLGFFPLSKTQVSGSSEVNPACKSFEAGEMDASQTLKALKLDIDDYSIGVNNTAKIFCSWFLWDYTSPYSREKSI